MILTHGQQNSFVHLFFPSNSSFFMKSDENILFFHGKWEIGASTEHKTTGIIYAKWISMIAVFLITYFHPTSDPVKAVHLHLFYFRDLLTGQQINAGHLSSWLALDKENV